LGAAFLGAALGAVFFGAAFFGAAFFGAAFFLGAAFAFVVFFVVAMVSPYDGEVSITGCSVFGFDTVTITPIELVSLVLISPRNGPALGCIA
jgi:hypothetical protein